MQAFPSCLLISQLLSSFRRDRIRSFTQAVWGVCVGSVCGACVGCVHMGCVYKVCHVCVVYDTSTCEEVRLQVGNALLLIHVRY